MESVLFLGCLAIGAAILAVPWLGVYLHFQRPPAAGTGRCVRCKYDLAGLKGTVCPECGAHAEGTAEAERASEAAATGRRGRTLGAIGVMAALPVVAALVVMLTFSTEAEQVWKPGVSVLHASIGEGGILLLGFVLMQAHLGFMVFLGRGRQRGVVTLAVAIGLLVAAGAYGMLVLGMLGAIWADC